MRRRDRERIEYLERQVGTQLEFNEFQALINEELDAGLGAQVKINATTRTFLEQQVAYNASLEDGIIALAERVAILEDIIETAKPKPIPMDDEAGLE